MRERDIHESSSSKQRRRAQGAELVEGGVSFRIWAPERRKVEVVLEPGSVAHSMKAEEKGGEGEGGHWSLTVPGVGAGTRYRYRLDGDGPALPDPAACFLPEGPHGPAEVIDHRRFAWTDARWTGLPLGGQVIYELHVATFSPEGNWVGARQKLAALAELGVTAIEVMPVGEFPGRFGWGYDGVAWFAPTHLYGHPDDFRAFVDAAHAHGLGVLLDVVYNHLGPDGNYLEQYARHYFSERSTEWGRALNYDGEQSAPLRSLVTDNAAYWIGEFHLDGLRLDATQSIVDASKEHVIAALGRSARAAAGGRRILLVGENEPQDSNLLRSTELGGMGLDGLWNDDFHHSAMVALTGRREAYYCDYGGSSTEWLAAAKHGFLYQGQRSAWQKKRRGGSTRGLPAEAFVTFLENHDQVANSLWGARVWEQSQAGCHRAMTTLLLLGPWTPMLFQGQEWNASTPFLYFADHEPALAELVRAGRAEFMSQFPGCASSAGRAFLPDPSSPASYAASRLRWEERLVPAHARALDLHRDLLALRRSEPTLGAQSPARVSLEIGSLGATCGVLRYFVDGAVANADSQDRLLIVNLGAELNLQTAAEPLLSPPVGPGNTSWRILWTSDDPRYGGNGCAEPDAEDRGFKIPACAAVLLTPLSIV